MSKDSNKKKAQTTHNSSNAISKEMNIKKLNIPITVKQIFNHKCKPYFLI